MADISDWSTTAASNNATPPDGAPEGMAPSGVNDVIRELMAAVRRWYEDAQWVNLGLTHTRVSSSSFSLTGDYTDIYEVGRRVKMTGSADGYGTISASSYSAPDTTVTLAENVVPGTLASVAISAISASNSSIPSVFAGNKSFSGSVAVGPPSSGVALAVTGLAATNAQTWTDGTRTLVAAMSTAAQMGTTSAHTLALLSGGNQRVEIASGGNITLNSPSSGITITVNGLPATTTQSWTDGTRTLVAAMSTAAQIGTSSAHTLALLAGGSQRIEITSAGNVTINSPSAGAALTVAGSIVSNSGTIRVPTAAADPSGSNGDIYYNSSSGKFRGYAGGWVDLH